MIKAASVGLGWWSDEVAESISCMNKKKYRIDNKEAVHNVEIMEAIVKSSSRKKIIYLES